MTNGALRFSNGVRRLTSRSGLLLLDTSLAAGISILIVLMAARSLPRGELDRFSVAQLLAVTIVGVARASVYAPAMAVQRSTGKAILPVNWIGTVSIPVAALTGLVFGPVIGFDPTTDWQWLGCLTITLVMLLSQDAARMVLISRDLVVAALLSDGLVVVFLVVYFITLSVGVEYPGDISAIRHMYVWGVAMATGLVVSLTCLTVFRSRYLTSKRQSLRATWSLGKWAALDSSLAGVASLLPMFVAALVLGGGAAGIYRTLQTSLGPLNIVHTTVVTTFSMDSWRISSKRGLGDLRKKVDRLIILMLGGGLIYVVIAIPVMIWFTQLSGPSLIPVAVVVSVGAIIGTMTTAPNAAALALGCHRYGAVIRAIVVSLSVVISLPWSVRTWVPGHDAIGSTLLLAALVGLLGWVWAYRRAFRRQASVLSAEDGA